MKVKNISNREIELPRTKLQELLLIAAENKEIISLGPGEPDFITPKPILDHVSKVIKKSTHYAPTEGYTLLREAIAKKIKRKNNINTTSDNIVITPGSQSAIFSSLLSIVDAKDKVVVPSPGYVGYIPVVELVDAIPSYLKLEEQDNFEVNPDKVKKLIDNKTRAIIINSPSNPTGAILSKKVLEELASIAINKKIYIISDEAYEDIIYGKKHISIASLNGMHNHVITLKTFSKSYAMCGFRTGYVIAPDKLAKPIAKVNHFMNISAPALGQHLALKALTISDSYTKDMVKEYKRRRDYLVPKLNSLALTTKMPYGAFYAFSNISNYSKDSFSFAQMLLKKAKVAVVPGTDFGPYGQGYIRFSYATDLNLIKKAMERIEKVL